MQVRKSLDATNWQLIEEPPKLPPKIKRPCPYSERKGDLVAHRFRGAGVYTAEDELQEQHLAKSIIPLEGEGVFYLTRQLFEKHTSTVQVLLSQLKLDNGNWQGEKEIVYTWSPIGLLLYLLFEFPNISISVKGSIVRKAQACNNNNWYRCFVDTLFPNLSLQLPSSVFTREASLSPLCKHDVDVSIKAESAAEEEALATLFVHYIAMRCFDESNIPIAVCTQLPKQAPLFENYKPIRPNGLVSKSHCTLISVAGVDQYGLIRNIDAVISSFLDPGFLATHDNAALLLELLDLAKMILQENPGLMVLPKRQRYEKLGELLRKKFPTSLQLIGEAGSPKQAVCSQLTRRYAIEELEKRNGKVCFEIYYLATRDRLCDTVGAGVYLLKRIFFEAQKNRKFEYYLGLCRTVMGNHHIHTSPLNFLCYGFTCCAYLEEARVNCEVAVDEAFINDIWENFFSFRILSKDLRASLITYFESATKNSSNLMQLIYKASTEGFSFRRLLFLVKLRGLFELLKTQNDLGVMLTFQCGDNCIQIPVWDEKGTCTLIVPFIKAADFENWRAEEFAAFHTDQLNILTTVPAQSTPDFSNQPQLVRNAEKMRQFDWESLIESLEQVSLISPLPIQIVCKKLLIYIFVHQQENLSIKKFLCAFPSLFFETDFLPVLEKFSAAKSIANLIDFCDANKKITSNKALIFNYLNWLSGQETEVVAEVILTIFKRNHNIFSANKLKEYICNVCKKNSLLALKLFLCMHEQKKFKPAIELELAEYIFGQRERLVENELNEFYCLLLPFLHKKCHRVDPQKYSEENRSVRRFIETIFSASYCTAPDEFLYSLACEGLRHDCLTSFSRVAEYLDRRLERLISQQARQLSNLIRCLQLIVTYKLDPLPLFRSKWERVKMQVTTLLLHTYSKEEAQNILNTIFYEPEKVIEVDEKDLLELFTANNYEGIYRIVNLQRFTILDDSRKLYWLETFAQLPVCSGSKQMHFCILRIALTHSNPKFALCYKLISDLISFSTLVFDLHELCELLEHHNTKVLFRDFPNAISLLKIRLLNKLPIQHEHYSLLLAHLVNVCFNLNDYRIDIQTRLEIAYLLLAARKQTASLRQSEVLRNAVLANHESIRKILVLSQEYEALLQYQAYLQIAKIGFPEDWHISTLNIAIDFLNKGHSTDNFLESLHQYLASDHPVIKEKKLVQVYQVFELLISQKSSEKHCYYFELLISQKKSSERYSYYIEEIVNRIEEQNIKEKKQLQLPDELTSAIFSYYSSLLFNAVHEFETCLAPLFALRIKKVASEKKLLAEWINLIERAQKNQQWHLLLIIYLELNNFRELKLSIKEKSSIRKAFTKILKGKPSALEISTVLKALPQFMGYVNNYWAQVFQLVASHPREFENLLSQLWLTLESLESSKEKKIVFREASQFCWITAIKHYRRSKQNGMSDPHVVNFLTAIYNPEKAFHHFFPVNTQPGVLSEAYHVLIERAINLTSGSALFDETLISKILELKAKFDDFFQTVTGKEINPAIIQRIIKKYPSFLIPQSVLTKKLIGKKVKICALLFSALKNRNKDKACEIGQELLEYQALIQKSNLETIKQSSENLFIKYFVEYLQLLNSASDDVRNRHMKIIHFPICFAFYETMTLKVRLNLIRCFLELYKDSSSATFHMERLIVLEACKHLELVLQEFIKRKPDPTEVGLVKNILIKITNICEEDYYLAGHKWVYSILDGKYYTAKCHFLTYTEIYKMQNLAISACQIQ